MNNLSIMQGAGWGTLQKTSHTIGEIKQMFAEVNKVFISEEMLERTLSPLKRLLFKWGKRLPFLQPLTNDIENMNSISLFYKMMFHSFPQIIEGEKALAKVFFEENDQITEIQKAIKVIEGQAYSQEIDLQTQKFLENLAGLPNDQKSVRNIILPQEVKEKQHQQRLKTIKEICAGKTQNKSMLEVVGLVCEKTKHYLVIHMATIKQIESTILVIENVYQNMAFSQDIMCDTKKMVFAHIDAIIKAGCLIIENCQNTEKYLMTNDETYSHKLKEGVKVLQEKIGEIEQNSPEEMLCKLHEEGEKIKNSTDVNDLSPQVLFKH